mgnify:FL=1
MKTSKFAKTIADVLGGDSLGAFIQPNPDYVPQRTVVRLVTSAWRTNRGIFTQRALLFLKRDSIGFNILEEDCANIGAPEVTQNILFENHPDGLYEVVTCNESRDWESGYIEEYDYQLIPYVREPR